MTTRKYIDEEDADEDGYRDVECPQCGAMINIRFQRGRRWRRLSCPVCQSRVTVSTDTENITLPIIQIDAKK